MGLRVSAARLAALALSALPVVAFAAVPEDCSNIGSPQNIPATYKVRTTNQNGTGAAWETGVVRNSVAATLSAFLAHCTQYISGSSNPCQLSSITYYGVGSGGHPVWRIALKYTYNSGATWNYSTNGITLEYSTASDASQCAVPEPECGNDGEGWYRDIRATNWSGVVAAVGTCYDGCSVTGVEQTGPGINKDPDGTFNFGAWIKTGGQVCAGGGGDTEPPTTPADKPQGENCSTSAAGVEYCNADAYGENCGYVNDKFVCLGKTDPDECWVNDDGSRLCGESAPTPPVPDNGAPGVPATPTDTIKASEGIRIDQVFNYYNTTSVANSSRPPTDTGNNPNRPSSSDPRTGVGGDGTDEGGGGSAEGGADCSAPPTCEGDAIACAALNQAWRARCPQVQTEAQMRAGISDTGVGSDGKFPAGSTVALTTDDFNSGGWLGGRSCPSPITADLGEFGGMVSYDPSGACGVLAILAQLVLASAWITGARIAFGA